MSVQSNRGSVKPGAIRTFQLYVYNSSNYSLCIILDINLQFQYIHCAFYISHFFCFICKPLT